VAEGAGGRAPKAGTDRPTRYNQAAPGADHPGHPRADLGASEGETMTIQDLIDDYMVARRRAYGSYAREDCAQRSRAWTNAEANLVEALRRLGERPLPRVVDRHGQVWSIRKIGDEFHLWEVKPPAPPLEAWETEVPPAEKVIPIREATG
jgi:hypothetical protein